MQCKDIPDWPILHFLANMPRFDASQIPKTGTWFWSETHQPDNSVLRAMPEGTPPRLALAKMKTLMRRGLVDGCSCGCRGNFELTEKGYLLLETYGPVDPDIATNFGLPGSLFGIPIVITPPTQESNAD